VCGKIKEIKRLLDVIKITDWSEIGDRIDEIKLIFDDIEKPKRKPLPDGTLPMTDEEKKEFKKLVNIAEDEFFERADLVKDHIQIWWRTKHCSWRYDELRSIKAIAYLLERFELIKED
jgi:hypothetical protein